jgi:enoyl-CoA hydratase
MIPRSVLIGQRRVPSRHLPRVLEAISRRFAGLLPRERLPYHRRVPATDVFTVERDGHVATIWLDSPERRNAMGMAFFEELPGHVAALDDDPDVRAIVLAARGSAFTVGLDLKEMGAGLAGGEGGGGGRSSAASRNLRGYQEVKRLQASFTRLATCRKPTIAAVHGWCIGGGIDLITCCDIRVASADTTFTVRETKIAIVADLGTLQRLPRVIASGHVAELAFTGKDFDAARAKDIGLVNEVFPDAEAAQAGARALADEIAANSPLVVQGVKQVLRAGEGRTVEEGLDYVAAWNSAFLASNDLIEAMSAFLEKRPPNFTGT